MELPPLALTFEDVLLVPGKSRVTHEDLDLSTVLARDLRLGIPVLSAAMDTVTEAAMARAMALEGGIGIVHTALDISSQVRNVRLAKGSLVPDPSSKSRIPDFDLDLHRFASRDGQGFLRCGAAVGQGPDVMERTRALLEAGVDVVVVDSQHGHHQSVIDLVARIRDCWPDLPLIAGNVATAEGVADLVAAGADAIKVGVGQGSMATTRVLSGVGVPQLTAVTECAAEAHRKGIPIIADGGIRVSGDVAKAVAAGADSVMLGSLLAGTLESPGELALHRGQRCKHYRASDYLEAMVGANPEARAARRGGPRPIGAHRASRSIEWVPYRGLVKETLDWLVGALRFAMVYVGCQTIPDLHARARFVRITSSGLRETRAPDFSPAHEDPNWRLD